MGMISGFERLVQIRVDGYMSMISGFERLVQQSEGETIPFNPPEPPINASSEGFQLYPFIAALVVVAIDVWLAICTDSKQNPHPSILLFCVLSLFIVPVCSYSADSLLYTNCTPISPIGRLLGYQRITFAKAVRVQSQAENEV